MNRELIANLIERHEGRRNVVYKDTLGNLTIGIGFNLDAIDARAICQQLGVSWTAACAGEVLPDVEIDALFDYTLNRAIADASALLPNFTSLPDQVQAVVTDMAFNLGRHGLSEFKGMLAALRFYNYQLAAQEAKNSLWYTQVGTRGVEDVEMLKTVTAGKV